jgi:hypothetical protein
MNKNCVRYAVDELKYKLVEYIDNKFTLVAVPVDDIIAIGFSVRHDNDKNFDKHTGVKRALDRALKWMDKDCTRYGKRLNEAPDYISVLYSVDLKYFCDRCSKYFKIGATSNKKFPKWIVNEVLSD